MISKKKSWLKISFFFITLIIVPILIFESITISKNTGSVHRNINLKRLFEDKLDGLIKSTNHVILNEVRMLLSKESPVGKNLSQLSTRFFVASLPQNDSFGSFYETMKLHTVFSKKSPEFSFAELPSARDVQIKKRVVFPNYKVAEYDSNTVVLEKGNI